MSRAGRTETASEKPMRALLQDSGATSSIRRRHRGAAPFVLGSPMLVQDSAGAGRGACRGLRPVAGRHAGPGRFPGDFSRWIGVDWCAMLRRSWKAVSCGGVFGPAPGGWLGVSARSPRRRVVEVHVVLSALSHADHKKPESVSRPAMATGSLNGGPKLASSRRRLVTEFWHSPFVLSGGDK